MKFLLLLLILVSCHKIKGVLEWTVIGKVTDYGQDVTLFCNVTNCCPKDSGWDRWTPVQRTLFIDVKSGRSNKKYNGQVFRDGYTLVIKNLTKDDLNVSYSCLYGVTIGEIKFLLEEDVFKYISTAQPNIRTGNSSFSKGEIAGILIGAVIVVAVPLVFVTICLYRRRKKRKEETIDFTGLLEGDEVRRFVRINVIGKDRVGKTSLVRTLLGKVFDAELKSTDGIDINRTRQIRVRDGKWTVGEVDAGKKMLIERIQHIVNIKQTKVSDNPLQSFAEDSDPTGPQNKHSDYHVLSSTEKHNTPLQAEIEPLLIEMQEHGTETLESNVLPITREDEHNSDRNTFNTPYTGDVMEERPCLEESTKIEIQTPELCRPSENETLVKSGESDNVTEIIIQQKSDIFKYAKKKKKKMTAKGLVECGIWDFAGQKDYYVTHQTFFTPHAIYILVADIMNEIKPINHNEFASIGDYIDFWLDSIHCFCEDPSQQTLCPPVIMVITGIDQIPDEQVKVKIAEYEKKLRDDLKNEGKIKHMRGIIHFISNKKPVEEEIESLKKHISDIADEMNYFTETLPIRWIQLEHAIVILKDSDKRSYAKWEHIESIAQTYSIKEEELICFLNYQHRIGNIIFFEDTRDYIILQPDWLIKCFRCLVCDDQKMNSGAMVSEWSNLVDNGILSTGLIEQLFRKDELSKFKECQTHILDVMEKFDIIVKTKSNDGYIDSYYMPCMIKKSSTLEQIKETFSVKDLHCTPWLVLEFEFLPIAIFNHILVYYIRKYTVCKIYPSDKASHPALYTGKAVVYLGDTKFRRLIICFSRNVIALQIWHWHDIKDILYKDILSKLCSYIGTLEKKLKNNLSYQIKAKCSLGNYLSMSDRYSFEELQKQCENGEYHCDEHATNHRENDLKSTWLKYAPDIEKERRAKQIEEKKKREEEKLLRENQTREKEENSEPKRKLKKMETDLGEIIPKNIREQIKRQVEDWEKKDKMFVSTRASDYVMKQLQDNSCLTLTAPSGVGKSFIARHTALLLKKEGYNIIPVEVPYDIRDYYQPGKKTVFIVDDICGNFTANQQQIENWKQQLPVINTIIADKCCKIIVSCRLQVYKDDKFNILSPFKSCECNLISDELCLTSVEKTNIAKTYIGTSMTDMDDLSFKYDFFPFLCSLYYGKEDVDVKEYFKNPFDFYKSELDRLSEHGDEGNYKICSLALCVLFNNQLNEEWFKGKETDEQRQIIKDTCEACGINSIPKAKLKKALDTLDGTFVYKQYGIYSTVHTELFDLLVDYFGQKMIECLIEHADSAIVNTRFIWQRSQAEDSRDFMISLPDDYLESYLERFIKDWFAGKVRVVFNNINMKVSSFREQLLRYILQLDKQQQVKLANTKDTAIPKENHESGTTPLKLACYDDYSDIVHWILQNDVNQCRIDGITGL